MRVHTRRTGGVNAGASHTFPLCTLFKTQNAIRFKCHCIISQSLRGGGDGQTLNALSLQARQVVGPGDGDAFLEGRCDEQWTLMRADPRSYRW